MAVHDVHNTDIHNADVGVTQVLATAHLADTPGHQLKLSPAAKSRFTEIRVPAYTEDELRQLLVQVGGSQMVLHHRGGQEHLPAAALKHLGVL